MVVWKFKCCPRCRGDIFLDKDLDGWREKCLQCSYERELKTLEEFMEQQKTEKKTVLNEK
ncbi:hypothetical protein ACFLVM_02640 [Chloroflexota bacterium]